MNDSNSWVTVALGCLTLATVITNAVIQMMRETRRRRWAIEDQRLNRQGTSDLRDDIASARQSLGTALAANTVLTASTSRELKVNTARTVEATTAAKAAFDEANHVNKKLEILGLRIRNVEDGSAS